METLCEKETSTANNTIQNNATKRVFLGDLGGEKDSERKLVPHR